MATMGQFDLQRSSAGFDHAAVAVSLAAHAGDSAVLGVGLKSAGEWTAAVAAVDQGGTGDLPWTSQVQGLQHQTAIHQLHPDPPEALATAESGRPGQGQQTSISRD
jgi:hypothetical protein